MRRVPHRPRNPPSGQTRKKRRGGSRVGAESSRNREVARRARPKATRARRRRAAQHSPDQRDEGSPKGRSWRAPFGPPAVPAGEPADDDRGTGSWPERSRGSTPTPGRFIRTHGKDSVSPMGRHCERHDASSLADCRRVALAAVPLAQPQLLRGTEAGLPEAPLQVPAQPHGARQDDAPNCLAFRLLRSRQPRRGQEAPRVECEAESSAEEGASLRVWNDGWRPRLTART